MTVDFTKNYFEVFELPENYDMDSQELTGRYQKLLKLFHPDKYSNHIAEEKRLALQYSARINEAYETLKSPLLRARYLAQIRLQDFGEKPHVQDQAFLEQQMAFREDFAQAKHSENPMHAIQTLRNKLDAVILDIRQNIKQLFTINDENSLTSVIQWVDRWQFCEKLQNDIEAYEEQLFQ